MENFMNFLQTCSNKSSCLRYRLFAHANITAHYHSIIIEIDLIVGGLMACSCIDIPDCQNFIVQCNSVLYYWRQ